MVYKFRVILDAEEDIFRDIAILADDTLEDTQCRSSILLDFGMEMASFLRETWNQEDEISLLILEMFLVSRNHERLNI
jgi:hypothetical protein